MTQRKPLINSFGTATEISAQDFADTFDAGWTAAVVALSQTVGERAVNADWYSASGYSQILNKPDLYYYKYLSSSSAAVRYIQIAELPQSTLGTYDQLRLNGIFNVGWAGVNNVPFDLTFGNRGATSTTTFFTFTLLGPPLAASAIVAYKMANDRVSIWVRMDAGQYAATSFSAQAFGNDSDPSSRVVMWNMSNAPEQVAVPTGTLVFDSSLPEVFKPLFYKDAAGFTFNSDVVAGRSQSTLSQNIMSNGGLLNGEEPAAGVGYEQFRMKVNYVAAQAYPGAFAWLTSSGNASSTLYNGYKLWVQTVDTTSSAWSQPLFSIAGDGSAAVAGVFNAGPIGAPTWGLGAHKLYRNSDAGGEILQLGGSSSSTPSLCVNVATLNVAGWNQAESVLYVARRDVSGRSANMSGTVNTGGSDYAEYMCKSDDCGTIAKGDIVGVDVNGRLTQKYDEAISFVIKTTNPSFVGGDTWDASITKPMEPTRVESVYKTVIDEAEIPYVSPNGPYTGQAHVPAKTHQELVSTGDSDDEWEAKQQAYEDSLAVYTHEFETLRERVDRIAFCGQVPVNVQSQLAVAGQYVVPTKSGDSIAALLIDKDDLTFAQYLHAIGRVIKVQEDGRPLVLVKTI